MSCGPRSRALALALLALPALACSSALPRPPLGPTPPDALDRVVPYPPPPARVEIVPPQKDPRAVWIGGQWDWDGRTWKWIAGAWTRPPAGAAYFTPWTAVRRPDGRLFFARATWRDAHGRPLGFGHEVCSRAQGNGG
jgi:hypothetical protein